MSQTIDQLLTIEEVSALIQKIRDNANAIWYLDGREYIKVLRGNRTIEIMIWYGDGSKALLDPVQPLADRWG